MRVPGILPVFAADTQTEFQSILSTLNTAGPVRAVPVSFLGTKQDYMHTPFCSLLSSFLFVRFYRWDAVEQPRVIRPSKTPQIARDILDEDPKDNDSESGRHDRLLSPDIVSPGPPRSDEKQEKTWLQTPSFKKSKTAATAAAFLQEGGCVPLSPGGGGEDNESEDGVASLQFAAQELSRRQLHQQQREGGIGEVLGRLRRPPSLEAVDGEEAGLGLGLRLGMEALSSPPPMRAAAEKAKACPPLWSPKYVFTVINPDLTCPSFWSMPLLP